MDTKKFSIKTVREADGRKIEELALALEDGGKETGRGLWTDRLAPSTKGGKCMN